MDLINGTFEFVGAAVLLLNVRRISRDRELRGASWVPTAFFASWGVWNLFYYPSLGQWFSFAGGLAVVSANAAWLWLVFRTQSRRREKRTISWLEF